MNNKPFNKSDIKIEYFRRSKGAGGQKLNKTTSSVRFTHFDTGIIVEASEGRSRSANKELALEKLQDRLNKIAEENKAKQQADAYNNKDDASFSSQIRTYRLCGNKQETTDHRTDIKYPTRLVLDGDIDIFLKGNLSSD